MKKLKHKTYILIAGLLIGAGMLVWLQKPDPQSPGIAANVAAEPEGETLALEELDFDPELQNPEGEFIESPFPQRRSRPLGTAEANSVRERINAREPLPHDVALDQYKATIWEEMKSNPPELLHPGDPDVDAEMAYQIYMYYGNCSMAPRTAANLDFRLGQITGRSENADERYLERMERAAEQTFNFYELCLAIPPEVDARLEAVLWMSEAVRLGHEIAEIQYYDKAMGFLLRRDRWSNSPPIVMLHSGLLQEFKSTARFALNRALEKGHPEAYLAMSQAQLDGVIFPKDAVLALAYARVAELEAMENKFINARIARQKSQISEQLNAEQLAEADELAHRLRLGKSV